VIHFVEGLRNNNIPNLAELILERSKERRVPRIPCDTQAMSDAVAAQKRPAPLGRSIFGRLLRCSSLTYRKGYASVLTPCLRLKSEPPNWGYYCFSTPNWMPSLLMAIVIFVLSSFSLNCFSSARIVNIDKIIHVLVYALFALLIRRSFMYSRNEFLNKYANSGAIICAVVFGMSDEFHQYFVPERYACFYDVCANTLGAVLSVTILQRIHSQNRNAKIYIGE